MKYERFEELPVWRAAVDLARRVYALTRGRFFSQSGDLRDQLRRAALSISNNVAEGFERGSTNELIAFLYIARGSAGEVRSMLCFAEKLLDTPPWNTDFPAPDHPRPQVSNPKSEISNPKSGISNLRSEISGLKALAESCSRQIRAWADHLQNSDIKGPRHLDDRARRQYEGRKRATTFQLQLAEILHRAHPEIYPDPNAAPEPPEPTPPRDRSTDP